MRALLLFLICMTAAIPALADPPDPPDSPAPMPEDVHRPRTEAGLKWFSEFGLGINYSFMSPNPTYRTLFEGEQRDFYESASGIGLLAYVGGGIRFSPMFSLVLRNDYDQKSAGRSGVSNDTVRLTSTGAIIGTQPTQKDYDVTITYETLALLAELNFGDLMVFVGPSVGIPLSAELSETNTILANSDPAIDLYYFFGSASQTKTISGSESMTDSLGLRVSVKIGLGYSFEVAPKFMVIPRIGYDFGFTEALTEDVAMRMSNGSSSANLPFFIQNDFKLSSIQASIGVRFTP